MNHQTKNNQNSTISELIQDGFNHAKDAFEKVLNSPVFLQRIDDDDYAIRKLSLLSESPSFVLKTELKGEMDGSCYLILTGSEARKLVSACLPDQEEGIFPGTLNEGFLKEVDNIVAGTMVSHLADYLQLMIYGDVPELLTVETINLESYLNEESENFDSSCI